MPFYALLSHGIKENSQLLERAWQMEWSFATSTAVPEGHTISPDIGTVFGADSFNNDIRCDVELMQEGQRMSDHIDHFDKDGKIHLENWAIIDFSHHSNVPNNLVPNVWYAFYAQDYNTITNNSSRPGTNSVNLVW